MRRRSWAASTLAGCTLSYLLLSYLLLSTARANPPDDVPVVTRHTAVIAGKTLDYSAAAGRIAIRDVETGEPHGQMFYTAYRVATAGAPRPIVFIWGGGPGGNSSWLHFYLAGPMLLNDKSLSANPDSWLSWSDVVFVDPVGTGFSRPLRREFADEFYNTRGDVASVTEFIRCWLIANAATGSPLFLAGESWGAVRAASVGYALEKRGIHASGLVLISGGFGLTQTYGSPTLLKALGVVDMASVALYWHKTAPELGTDREKLRQQAEAWVRGTYAPALGHLDRLSGADRRSIIAQLSRFTGIPAAKIDSKSLVISPHTFRTALLGKDRVVDLLDGRRTHPFVIQAVPLVLSYFRQSLEYRTDLPYVGLTDDDLQQGYAPSGHYPESVNERWNYATAELSPEQVKAAVAAAAAEGGGPPRLGPPLPGTREAVLLDPRMRVLVAVGMYDPYQQCARGEQIERDLPAELRHAITFRCYPGGHAMYLGEPTIRAELTRDVMQLVHSAESNP